MHYGWSMESQRVGRAFTFRTGCAQHSIRPQSVDSNAIDEFSEGSGTCSEFGDLLFTRVGVVFAV